MIKLNCTNCRREMAMDEAFAGGVCRCKHCGTIQTVPSNIKTGAAVSAKKKSGAGRALYSKSRVGADGIPSSGLDQLAQAVASSGLTSGRLRQSRLQKQTILIALIAIVAGGFITWFAMRGSPHPASGAGAPLVEASAGSAQPSPAAAASFCGLPLNHQTVVYLLDRGSGAADYFSYLKEVTLRSAESLGEDRRFQIIFWNNGADDAYPFTSPTFASAKNIESARRALDDVYPSGQTDITPALRKAIAAAPDAIVLATGKGSQLGDDFVQQIMGIRGDKPVKIYTFDVGGSEVSTSMKAIAEKTGGTSQLLTEGQLTHFAKE